jgi:dihydrofolate reductase
MAKLIYTAITSLDGYVADANGNFDWAAPDDEVHAFVNELERPVGTYLYGRRLYEVMAAWETMDDPLDDDAARRLWDVSAQLVGL